ncbi:hypothetical protein HGA13_25770 [Nocardia speluncae]|uniref:Uncharacterized protein n=1 Tax=Nocardia speluncae TaxID=419477 RepID=A0A846XP43_9NOCA|nr:hypothetical protein [Nocardia speluncae]NKY36450.1 hypothetical protein [Nocardia speluncae]
MLTQLGVGAATAAAVVGSDVIAGNVLVAFVIGTATPVVVKKLSTYVQSVLPGDADQVKGPES